MAHAKQGSWGSRRGPRLNNSEELSYYVYKGYQLSDVNDGNKWDVRAFGGVGHIAEVQESGWVVGEQTIQLS